MTTAEWITASLVLIIAAILAVVSIRSFQNKGFLFKMHIFMPQRKKGERWIRSLIIGSQRLSSVFCVQFFLSLAYLFCFIKTSCFCLRYP